MLFADGALGLALLGLWLFCLIDVIMTDDSLCRNLQKGWWLLIVLLLFDIGAVVWLIAGRPWPNQAPGRGRASAYGGAQGGSRYAEYDRPGRFVATNPDDDEEFLRRCRERAEEQRQRYREQKRRAEEQGSGEDQA